MKIKNYKLFLENRQSNEDINFICQKYSIKNYIINSDGTVDVDGDVNLRYQGLIKLPLKFGKVTGNFYCGHNKLTSLEGSPYYVGGDYFDCTNNQLKTLEGGPKIVMGSYSFFNNNILNFKGFPEEFDGYINYYDTPVSKLLENIPEEYDKWIKFIYWCNEYDAITDNGEIIPERMEEVYNKLGLEYNEEN